MPATAIENAQFVFDWVLTAKMKYMHMNLMPIP